MNNIMLMLSNLELIKNASARSRNYIPKLRPHLRMYNSCNTRRINFNLASQNFEIMADRGPSKHEHSEISGKCELVSY